MADEDLDSELGDDAGMSSGPAKKSGMGGLLPTLLKYIALALGAIILIVTVVIITINVMGGNKTRQVQIPISEEYKEYAEELDWYQSLGGIQVKTRDNASVDINVFLGYQKEDKVASAEISAQKIPIRDYLRYYFASKNAEDLTPNNEERLKIEIRNEINDTILHKSKIKKISFDKLNVVPQ